MSKNVHLFMRAVKLLIAFGIESFQHDENTVSCKQNGHALFLKGIILCTHIAC